MKLTLEGTPKEAADLVLEIQSRHENIKTKVTITDDFCQFALKAIHNRCEVAQKK